MFTSSLIGKNMKFIILYVFIIDIIHNLFYNYSVIFGSIRYVREQYVLGSKIIIIFVQTVTKIIEL